MRQATKEMAAARCEGEVEGRPTHSGNFLQRIDELVSKEKELAEAWRAIKAGSEWRNTLERELDEARKDSERLDVLDQEFSYYVRDSDAGDLSWRSVDFSADVTGIKDLRAGIDRFIGRSPGRDAAREGDEDE